MYLCTYIYIYTYICMEATFLKSHLTDKIDLVEVAYYLKQVFQLLYTKCVTPAEALHYFSLTSLIAV